MLAECFKGILGACRSEAACGRSKRGDARLVETDQKYKRKDQDLPYDDGCLIFPRFHFLSLLLSASGFRSVL